MPEPLNKKAFESFILATLVLILAVAVSIATKNARNLVILIIAAYLVYNGISITQGWKKGRILEIPAYCVSVQPAPITPTNLNVIFTTNLENSPTMTFTVAKKNSHYAEGLSYILYVHKYNNAKILASEPVA